MLYAAESSPVLAWEPITMPTMFTPRFEALLALAGVDPAAYREVDTVTLQKDVFEFLVRVMLLAGEFDAEAYLEANPDVRQAVERGDIKDAFVHYLHCGYFEGRDAASAEVDEGWYLRRYPDVAKAVRSGEASSGADHYRSSGHVQWRLASPKAREALAPWRALLYARGVTVD